MGPLSQPMTCILCGQVGSGCTWVPLRDAALEAGTAGGAWMLLLLVCLCNTLLALLPGE